MASQVEWEVKTAHPDWQAMLEVNLGEGGGPKYLGQRDAATGSFEGVGIKAFLDGSRFEGQWRDSKANGLGKLFYPEGHIYEGTSSFSLKTA